MHYCSLYCQHVKVDAMGLIVRILVHVKEKIRFVCLQPVNVSVSEVTTAQIVKLVSLCKYKCMNANVPC